MSQKSLFTRVITKWREEGYKDFLRSVIKYLRIQASFFTSQHRRLVIRAKRNRKKIHYTHSISQDGLVLDIGAYKGDWIRGLENQTEFGEAHLFEPMPDHIKYLRSEFRNKENIFIHDYGIGSSTCTTEMAVLENSSSAYNESGDMVTVKFRSATEVLEEFNRDIELMKINVEGSEYDILFDLIEHEKMSSVRTLIVQFHQNVSDYKIKREKIHEELKKTHDLEINYPYVWEVWKQKE